MTSRTPAFNPLNRLMQSESFNVDGCAPAIDLHKLGASKTSKSIPIADGASAGEGIDIDANVWLPQAAEHYNISPNIQDYVLAPIPATITSIPNTNGDCFTTKRMLEFIPDLGQLAYKTFKGKPTHVEHVNKDYSIAKGVIFDAYLKPLRGFGGNHARLILLLGFDRTRDPVLAEKIASNQLNTYSIGAHYNAYQCSVCGHVTEQKTMITCSHTKLKVATYLNSNRQLTYRELINFIGFECSAVEDPAFVSAHHNPNQLMDVSKLGKY